MDSIIFRHEIEGYTAKEERVYLYAHFIQKSSCIFLVSGMLRSKHERKLNDALCRNCVIKFNL
jgi:hypothetical protein